MGEVGVGYDGSPESDRALELGRLVAAEHHAKLSAFQAVSTPAYLCLGYLASPAPVESVSIPREVDQARERIAAVLSRRAASVACRSERARGRPEAA